MTTPALTITDRGALAVANTLGPFGTSQFGRMLADRGVVRMNPEKRYNAQAFAFIGGRMINRLRRHGYLRMHGMRDWHVTAEGIKAWSDWRGQCECGLRGRLVGDGCQHCNPRSYAT